MEKFKGTAIVAVKRNGKTAIAGEGQVTFKKYDLSKYVL